MNPHDDYVKAMERKYRDAVHAPEKSLTAPWGDAKQVDIEPPVHIRAVFNRLDQLREQAGSLAVSATTLADYVDGTRGEPKDDRLTAPGPSTSYVEQLIEGLDGVELVLNRIDYALARLQRRLG